jgi:hypothetical protein
MTTRRAQRDRERTRAVGASHREAPTARFLCTDPPTNPLAFGSRPRMASRSAEGISRARTWSVADDSNSRHRLTPMRSNGSSIPPTRYCALARRKRSRRGVLSSKMRFATKLPRRWSVAMSRTKTRSCGAGNLKLTSFWNTPAGVRVLESRVACDAVETKCWTFR